MSWEGGREDMAGEAMEVGAVRGGVVGRVPCGYGGTMEVGEIV